MGDTAVQHRNNFPPIELWVGRSSGGLMRWVFDPEVEHPDEDFLYGYSVASDDMREYRVSVVQQTLTIEVGGNTAAIEQYLKWRQLKGDAFLAEETSRQKIAVELSQSRLESERQASLQAEEDAKAQRADYIANLKSKMIRRQTTEANGIRNLISERNIPYLVHFTRIENIAGILEHGIIPRTLLSPGFRYNDEMRLDGFPESTSLSISFPNWQMFYRCRCAEKNRGANWVVLAISAETLSTHPCLFFPTNAANRRFQDDGQEAFSTRMGLTGLNSMFPDDPPGVREARGLPEKTTTDPQAEILVFDRVPPEQIGAISLMRSDITTEALIRRQLPTVKLNVGGKLFDPRSDYKFWQVNAKVPLLDTSDDFPF